jgi:galactokinase
MMLDQRTRDGFIKTFGHHPDGVIFAPGRVNLIGEHVDYNAGLVLPMPISVGTAIAWSRRDKPGIEAIALDLGEERDRFEPGQGEPHHPADWRSYLRGMAQGLTEQGIALPGAQLAITGTIPRGSGLSSSASLCVAIGRALSGAAGVNVAVEDLARVAQLAEHCWAGVHCGIMDQMAVAAGTPGAALLLDCADLATQIVPLPADWAVMIVQSGVRRGLVDGHYNRRREDCEAAARAMGVASLRHADSAMVARAGLDPVIERRALHVVEEIARVSAAVAAIEAHDLPALGRILRASHASLRDLFEVSEPNVDALVEVLNTAIGGNGGARMTGGGFGGAVVAVLPASEVSRVKAAIRAGYAPPDGSELNLTIERTGHVLA